MWKATLSAPAPALPEGCIAHVLAFTTLRNACRMPAVLSVFLLASESGVVWERFLPSDYPNILGRSLESSSQLDFSSSLDLRGQKDYDNFHRPGCPKIMRHR
ncbi:F-box protein SKIP3 isoform X5 [Vitis vinifera]|uniref:F-box protein SKIP3 isoform X5 n=1 Tax=Vitis vinifera TaxID=29760 RepID=UPI0028830F80|nr:F-box protein SKIP3 isoform X5 [Vitis vinifera]